MMSQVATAVTAAATWYSRGVKVASQGCHGHSGLVPT